MVLISQKRVLALSHMTVSRENAWKGCMCEKTQYMWAISNCDELKQIHMHVMYICNVSFLI